MENKTLSEQICEVCGIEPIEEKYCYHECKKPELKNVPCYNSKCEYYRHFIKYPNFENNNNNFVKLLELNVDKSTIGSVITFAEGCPIVNKKTFLKDLLTFLSSNTLCKKEEREQIKQAIRQADWEV